jgi:hypothetical protein
MKRILAAILTASAVSAKATELHPLDVPVRQYGLVLALALLGGLVSFYAKVKAGTVQANSLFVLIGELVTSAFAGLLAFYGCAEFGVSPFWTAIIVGVAGHMGAKVIALAEMWGQAAAQRKFGPP